MTIPLATQIKRLLKEMPQNVVVHIEMRGVRFVSEPLHGADVAQVFFKKNPMMRDRIRNLQMGETTDAHDSTTLVNFTIAVERLKPGQKAELKSSVVRRARVKPNELNPDTGRPWKHGEREAILEAFGKGEIEFAPLDEQDLPFMDAKTEASHEIEDGDAKFNRSACKVCKLPEYKTSRGVTCKNMHGELE